MRQIMDDVPATMCANPDNETEHHENLDANSIAYDEDAEEEACDPEATVNLLSKQYNSTDKCGNARLYTVNGTKFAATQGQIYAHRDEALADFNLQEFQNGYVIRQIYTLDDKKWAAGHAIDRGPGRNATRYFIREPCELRKKYLIGGRAKYRITAYKGAPMPLEPKTDEEDNYEQFAEWFLTQKKPFSISSKIKDDDETWSQASEAYLDDLEHDACLYREREKDLCESMTMAEKLATKNMRDRRLVAASRLADIKNDLEGFTSTNKARTWSEAFRGRSRTLWYTTNRPSSKTPRQYCRGIDESMREVQAYIDETNDTGNFPNASKEDSRRKPEEAHCKAAKCKSTCQWRTTTNATGRGIATYVENGCTTNYGQLSAPT